ARVRLLRPLPHRERPLELRRDERAGRAAPFHIACQLILRLVTSASEQTLRDYASRLRVRPRYEHADLARTGDERRRIERARVDERTERIADCQSDERPFVSRSRIDVASSARGTIAPSADEFELLLRLRDR